MTYEFYQDTYGDGLSEAAFAASLPMAESHACCDLFGRVHHWELKVR